MISKDYALSLLVWVVVVGSATLLTAVFVKHDHRRRAIYQTLLFTIALTMAGFIDAISRQLNLLEPGIGVAVMAMLALVGMTTCEWLLGKRSLAQAVHEEKVAP